MLEYFAAVAREKGADLSDDYSSLVKSAKSCFLKDNGPPQIIILRHLNEMK